MPLSRLSKQYGTVMFRLNFRLPEAQSASRPALASSNSNSQAPLRLSQRSRWNWGWGYSGRGMAAAWRAQQVRSKRAADLCMVKSIVAVGQTSRSVRMGLQPTNRYENPAVGQALGLGRPLRPPGRAFHNLQGVFDRARVLQDPRFVQRNSRTGRRGPAAGLESCPTKSGSWRTRAR